jgi:protein-S-isoprenylcysteine O-methyltransferase Ste14
VPSPRFVIWALWVAWVFSWVGAGWWSRATEKRADVRGEIRHRLVIALGAVLIAISARSHEGLSRLWHVHRVGAWICVAAMVCGFAFCWWGRIHLGALWSARITKKTDHRVVDTGPYAIVRHPIYTGILVAVYALIAAQGTAIAIAGGVILTIGIVMRARFEEEWLTQELGKDEYQSYRRRVPMLVPFGPRAR